MIIYWVYTWGNNPKRLQLKGRVCTVVAWLSKNSCIVEFVDDGSRECVSRYSIQRKH
jgi:hypothetical protein